MSGCTDREIAAACLFGPRWSIGFLDCIRIDAAFDAQRLCVDWAKGGVRDGQGRSISVDRSAVDFRGGDAGRRHGASDFVALILLWTGSFENLIIYAGVGLSLFSMLAVSSIYVLRSRASSSCTGHSGRLDIRPRRRFFCW